MAIGRAYLYFVWFRMAISRAYLDFVWFTMVITRAYFTFVWYTMVIGGWSPRVGTPIRPTLRSTV